MISFTELQMPTLIKSDSQSANGTVGALPFWNIFIEASKTVRELLTVLDNNIQIPGVLIFEQKTLIGMITREDVYEKLGRLFGVELFLENNNKQFYESLEMTTLVWIQMCPWIMRSNLHSCGMKKIYISRSLFHTKTATMSYRCRACLLPSRIPCGTSIPKSIFFRQKTH